MSSQQNESGAIVGGGALSRDNVNRDNINRIRAALLELKAQGEAEGLVEDGRSSVVLALRDEYKTHLDLYKHYLTVAASFNVFYYGVTGAVVSYAISGENNLRAYALLFTVLMSYFFARVFGEARKVFEEAEDDIKNIADSLGLKRNEVRILTQILKVSNHMYIFNCFALSALFYLKLSGGMNEPVPPCPPLK